ncbi:MAG: Preprotein translocase SecG subunit [Acidobacteriota bacterium]|nr:Preprotein translocase SecG subunit [Acidobacteriota bacterium]
MLSYFLYGLFILACFVLIISVLLQPGKADAGSLFTSSISSAAFGPRGTQTILAKITVGAAATFFIVALLLGLGVGGGQHSLMEGGVAPQATPTPAAPAEGAAPAASPAAQPAEGATAPATPAASPAAVPATTASPATK